MRSSAGFASTRSASAPTNPAPPSCTRAQLGGDVFDGSGFGGRRAAGSEVAAAAGSGGFLVADEPTLKAVAEQTGGTYHGAKDADQLSRVFKDLPKEVATQKRPTEVTWILAALGALLAAGGARGLDALEPLPVAPAERAQPLRRAARGTVSPGPPADL